MLNGHFNKRSFINSSLVVEDVLYWLKKMQLARGPSIKDVDAFFRFLTPPSPMSSVFYYGPSTNEFDFSSLQIADVFHERPFTLIPERILRSCYSQSPKRIDLCATCYGNAICSLVLLKSGSVFDNNAYNLPSFFFLQRSFFIT